VSVGTILSIAYWLLRLANSIFSSIDQERLMRLGEDRANAKALSALLENSKELKEIDERFDAMTDQEVLDEITKQGDWRD
jgi:tRNA A37 N6-isopentenylltransferase MiaA